MNRLQKWFEQMVGVSPEERQRRALAQAVFYAPRPHNLALETPACWRRKRFASGVAR